MDLDERIMELSSYGYACGQILMLLLLETTGEENPALVRCMQGVSGGIGGSGDLCGCMPAGCCLISYFTGKAGDSALESSHHKEAIGEFTQWFTEETKTEYGGIDCREIVGGDPAKKLQFCPAIIAATYEKCMEILENRGLL
ncbi:MAG: C-GCAxxG-C-C family protein [Bacillota bacterium]|nr:C-GCAxxG-C-C family protein [Bacillota bacterium]